MLRDASVAAAPEASVRALDGLCGNSYHRRIQTGIRLSAAAGAAALIAAGGAAAAPTDADLSVRVVAGQAAPEVFIPPIENGGTRTVASLTFRAGVALDNAGPDLPTARIRFELPEGLRWGTDEPDASEGCTATPSRAECEAPPPVGMRGGFGWAWDVIAAGPGSYTLRTEILSTTAPDPNLANNAATATVVVAPRTPSPVASAVTVTPRRPRAGAVVSGRTRVTLEGEPLTPTALRCRGRIGRVAVRGTGRTRAGSATCSYRTRSSNRGKTLAGTLEFTAGGTSFTRRFSVKLR